MSISRRESKGTQKKKSSVSEDQKIIADSSLEKRCDRVIYRNKYERNAPEICSWWYKLFKILEDDAAIPPDKQLPMLEEILPQRLLSRVLSKLSTVDRKFKEELESLSEDDQLTFQRLRTGRSSFRTDKRDSAKSIFEPEELRKNAEDIDEDEIQKGKSQMFQKFYGTSLEIPKSKMYTDFFKRKIDRAAVWRTLPPLSLDEMDLNQKAEAITEKIATDFIEWLRDLGGDEELSLSVQAVIEMFEIGFHANSATSLRVNVKELPSVPKKVADAKNLPERAKRAVLHNEIKKDIKASKKKTTYVAFGSRLPFDMQVRPPAENYYKKWMSCDKVPERLASMAAVWQGITHLKSTRAYCEFLLERPEIKPPKYLLDCGMLNLKYLKDKDLKSDDPSFELFEM